MEVRGGGEGDGGRVGGEGWKRERG